MSNLLHGIVLFSGGLDSILSAKLLQDQGIGIQCLHLTSPFFGDAKDVPHWRKRYGLDIVTEDVSDDFVALLRARPQYGFGKIMNPCVDCKILLLRRARRYMESVNASFLATGEVIGQRPMSQRRDTLFAIMRDAGVADILLRPLCAQHLPPTAAERSGLVDRTRLLGFSGRGRRDQLNLAAHFGLKNIPTPGGGCKLTERENARRYWSVLTRNHEPSAADFVLADLGRHFSRPADDQTDFRLSIGRNSKDNERLQAAAGPDDSVLTLYDLPGPLAVARRGRLWPSEALEEAAAITASYSPKAVQLGIPVKMRVSHEGTHHLLEVTPRRPAANDAWRDPAWDTAREEIRAEMRIAQKAAQTRSATIADNTF